MSNLRIALASMIVAVTANGAANSQSSATPPEPIVSEFSQFVPLDRQKLYDIVANIENHPKLLRNIKGRIPIPHSDLTKDAIASNELITMSFVYEPSNRLAISRFRFFPPRLIEEEMVTSPFADGGAGILDKKKGTVSYIFEEAPGGTMFTAKSTFMPDSGRVYTRDWIDGTWRSFLTRLVEEARRQ